LSFATLSRSIALSGEKRWLYQLPPFVGQPLRGGATSDGCARAPALR